MAELSAWGIDERYRDEFGHWHEVPQETKSKFLSVMRDGQGEEPEAGLIVLRHGHDHRLPSFSEIVLEDGTQVSHPNRDSVKLPLGYHAFFDGQGRESRLIVVPAKCHLPPDLHTWGWALQLYSLRSESSWGIGDLEDLRRLAKWSAELGAGAVMVNP
ncbi:MAG TPA: 4-alpha-glucanotransferase, partial [Candidatus Acidoferrum sp.]